MICTKCRNEISEEDLFCEKCGKKLNHENLTDKQQENTTNSSELISNAEQSDIAEELEPNNDEEENNTQTVTDVSTGGTFDKIGVSLILLAIGLVIAPFIYVIDIADAIQVINNGDFEFIKDGFKNLMYFNMISSLILLVFYFALCLFFFTKTKNKFFPKK
jgi:Fe2+ transport system protein B